MKPPVIPVPGDRVPVKELPYRNRGEWFTLPTGDQYFALRGPIVTHITGYITVMAVFMISNKLLVVYTFPGIALGLAWSHMIHTCRTDWR